MCANRSHVPEGLIPVKKTHPYFTHTVTSLRRVSVQFKLAPSGGETRCSTCLCEKSKVGNGMSLQVRACVSAADMSVNDDDDARSGLYLKHTAEDPPY